MFIDTEANDHTQRNVLKEAIVGNKKLHCVEDDIAETVHFDSPYFFDIKELLTYIKNRNNEKKDKSNDIPVLLVYEEAHKYVPNSDMAKYRASKQCNNFLALRLTNPIDQNYVKRLLPDTMGSLVNKLPSLCLGEGILVGDAVVLPSVVKVDECGENAPSSNDIPYYELWKEEWKDLDMSAIREAWIKY